MTGSVLFLSVNPFETRVALMENSRLVSYRAERHRTSSVVGNLYKGRVSRVLPGMQAAFVDVGLARNAFLYVREAGGILDDFTDMNPMGSLLALHLGRKVYPRQPSSLIQGPRAKRGPMFDLFAYHGDEKRPGCPTCRRIYKLVGASVFPSEEQVQDEIDKLIPADTAFRGA